MTRKLIFLLAFIGCLIPGMSGYADTDTDTPTPEDTATATVTETATPTSTPTYTVCPAVATDSFSRPDSPFLGVAPSGQAWETHLHGSAGFGIKDHKFTRIGNFTDTDNDADLAVVYTGNTNVTVSVTITRQGFDNGTCNWGLVTRFVDATSYLLFKFDCGMEVFEVQNGGYSEIGSVADSVGEGDVVTVVDDGTNFNVLVNGSSIITGTSSQDPGTKQGLLNGSWNDGMQFDGFSVLGCDLVPSFTPTPTPRVAVYNFSNGKFNSLSPLVGWSAYYKTDPNCTDCSISLNPVTSTAHYKSAPLSALLGDTVGTDEPWGDTVVQQRIKVSEANPVLNYWIWPYASDDLTYDWQRVEVRDLSDNLLETPLMQCLDDQTWIHKTFDLGKYRGKDVVVKFIMHGDDADDNSAMYLDDVSMSSRQPGLGDACGRSGGSFAAGDNGESSLENMIDSVDATGIFVCDYDNQRIIKYSYAGKELYRFTTTSTYYGNINPYYVAQDKNTDLYVSWYGGVAKFTKSGKWLYDLSLNHNTDGGASGLAVDASGNVYVTEEECGEGCQAWIEKFSRTGISLVAAAGDSVEYYEGLALNPKAGTNGILYVSRPGSNNPYAIYALDAKTLDGLFAFGNFDWECPANGDFNYPEAIVVLPNGNVAITDWSDEGCFPGDGTSNSGNNGAQNDGTVSTARIQVFTWDGNYLGQFGSYGEAACQARYGFVGLAYHDRKFYMTADGDPNGVSIFKQCALPAPTDGSADVLPVPTPSL